MQHSCSMESILDKDNSGDCFLIFSPVIANHFNLQSKVKNSNLTYNRASGTYHMEIIQTASIVLLVYSLYKQTTTYKEQKPKAAGLHK